MHQTQNTHTARYHTQLSGEKNQPALYIFVTPTNMSNFNKIIHQQYTNNAASNCNQILFKFVDAKNCYSGFSEVTQNVKLILHNSFFNPVATACFEIRPNYAINF